MYARRTPRHDGECGGYCADADLRRGLWQEMSSHYSPNLPALAPWPRRAQLIHIHRLSIRHAHTSSPLVSKTRKAENCIQITAQKGFLHRPLRIDPVQVAGDVYMYVHAYIPYNAGIKYMTHQNYPDVWGHGAMDYSYLEGVHGT